MSYNNPAIPFSADPSEVLQLTPQGPVPSSCQASTSSSDSALGFGSQAPLVVITTPSSMNNSLLSPSESENLPSVSKSEILAKLALGDALQSHVIWPQPAPDLLHQCPGFANETYSEIKSTNLPIYLGAQIQVDSALNTTQWRLALTNYHDQDLCGLLAFGWPVGYLKDSPPVAVTSNHPSATNSASSKFIDKERSINGV